MARSYVAANMTPAALFRVIEQHAPTLVLDEVDRYLAQDEVLNGIMNAGHTRRTATVTRLIEVDSDYIPTNSMFSAVNVWRVSASNSTR